MEVLDLFNTTRRELGVVEVARLLDRPKSTVSGWMSAMHEVGLLDREDGMGPYRLGIRLAALGELARRSTLLQREAKPFLEQLTRRTRETSSANVLVGSSVVNSVVVESPQPILSAGGVGIPMPIHATAAGKVLVAWKPQEEVRHLLPMRLERFATETIQDVEAFFEELAETRKRGYAVAHGELADDLFALSAPVRDSSGSVVGAISVAAPLWRIADDMEPRIADDVMATAEQTSTAMGFRPEVLATGTG